MPERTTSSDSPLISVALATYNHQDYIGDAIRSVLEQTIGDWELVVVDDGSTDKTADIARSFKDPRIRVIAQSNQGPGASLNTAVSCCRGEYIALMSGDDVCKPNRLERQLTAYRRGSRRLLFSACEVVDQTLQPLPSSHELAQTFQAGCRSSPELLAHFFYHLNFLCAPTCFTERALFQELGPHDTCLFQLQDLDIWIRAAKCWQIDMLPDVLLSYRVLPDQGNLSVLTPERHRRLWFEHHLIMQRFFDGLSAELFREAFYHKLLQPEEFDDISLRFEQAMLFIDSSSAFPRNFLHGIAILRELLNEHSAAELVERKYHFTPPAFAKLLLTAGQGS